MNGYPEPWRCRSTILQSDYSLVDEWVLGLELSLLYLNDVVYRNDHIECILIRFHAALRVWWSIRKWSRYSLLLNTAVLCWVFVQYVIMEQSDDSTDWMCFYIRQVLLNEFSHFFILTISKSLYQKYILHLRLITQRLHPEILQHCVCP